ncbi:glycerophosphoryl diester phosphodiesterase [Pseudovibrio sp. Tun.PSC04-5.I4]|nr:glycerophosphoryl diester phosphodiesterase [Pseudovibrio sp. Tun.PSC04-5.I4]
MSVDDVPIVLHDPNLPTGGVASEHSYSEILKQTSTAGTPVPTLEEVVKLAAKYGVGVYADIKAEEAAIPSLKILQSVGLERVVIGAFSQKITQALQAAGCTYPVSSLIPIGEDPFEFGGDADVLHLCWERMKRPQDLLDAAFFEKAEKAGKVIALWREEDPNRMADIRGLPVFGICSDRPELVQPFRPSKNWPVKVVCHRGANKIAPENTLSSAHCAFAAGFSHVELDTHYTADDKLVVIHDPLLERTTNGTGPVVQKTLAELRDLDAGSWFDPFFKNEKIPTLDEILTLTKLYDGELYVELKSASAKRVVELVQSHGLLHKCFFWSFVSQSVADVRTQSKEALLMTRRLDFDSVEEAINWQGAHLVEFSSNEDFSEFETCRKMGVKSMVAYMGDDPKVFKKIIDARADMVNIDKPFLFARICREMGLTVEFDRPVVEA